MAGNFGYIEKNLEEVRARINNAKLKRDNKYVREVRLMAVTKTVPVEKINFAVGQGIDLIGENRVNELLAKYDGLPRDRLEVHFIGALQTNKVRQIIDKVDLIQSVDSLRLAEEINKRAAVHSKIMDVFVEINIGGEASKAGVSPEGCGELIDAIKDFDNIRVRGLMTIPPYSLDKQETREYFSRMREIHERLGTDMLSMGMSGDFEQAIECGADIIRVGTRIFGERQENDK